MAEINTVIAEASQDLQTIEDFVNLPADSDVFPRLLPSVNVGTLAGARQAIFEAGGLPAKPFATKALMTASALANDKYAMVTDDTVNNGLYIKTAGAWVKSNYDPLTQAKADATTKADAAKAAAVTEATALSASDTSQKILKSQVAYNFVETEALLSTRQKTIGSYISNSGELMTDAPTRTLTVNIPVTPEFYIKYDAYIAVGMSSIAAYDASGVFIKSLLSGTTNKQESGIITFSSDIASIRISIATTQPNSFLLLKVVGLNDALKKYQLIGDVDLLLENPPVSGSYVDTSGADVVSSTWSRTGLIEVSSGLVITYNTYSSRLTSTIAAYDSNAVFLYPLLSVAGDVVGSLTIPSNVKYISISIANSKVNNFTIAKAVAKSGDGSGGSAVSRYFGAKWLSMGTSIVDSTATPYTYQKWVSEKMGLALFNHASSGSRTRSSLYRKNTNLDEHITASDFITIDHGTNDFKIETPLGSISDTPTPYATMKSAAYNENSDTTGTFYADLKSVIEYIYSIKPSARIMLITPIKRTQPAATGTETNSLGLKLVDYSNAIKAISELYSLPCLDNYNTSGFNLNTIPVWTADGLHPTEWAQKNVLTNKMIGFIESN